MGSSTVFSSLTDLNTIITSTLIIPLKLPEEKMKPTLVCSFWVFGFVKTPSLECFPG
ncbi:hypothetical protein MKW98_021481, partial [Papaver atlanticum]